MKTTGLSAIILTLMLMSVALAFNIHSAMATGTIYIRQDGSVEGTDRIQRDGDTYTFTDKIYDSIVVERNNTVIDGKGYTLQGTGAEGSIGIDLTGITNVTVRSTQITNFGVGIVFGCGFSFFPPYLGRCSNQSIIGNNIENNGYGIGGSFCQNNTIIGNNIENNGYGIDLIRVSSYNNISGNNINANNGVGVLFGETCHFNTISGNKITANNGDGITLGFISSYNSITGNNITANNGDGIAMIESVWYNDISENTIKANNGDGIYFQHGNCNNITANTIENNKCGIGLEWGRYSPSSDNIFYHNNFIANAKQVDIPPWLFPTNPTVNVWDDDYPSGGNYWSDYCTRYPSAKEIDDSGIWDIPYVICENNTDNYPLMNPWLPTLTANVNIDPNTLNLKSEGKWITAYIELPEGYDVADINVSTLTLNSTFPSEPKPTDIGDHDGDGVPDLMVKFNRTAVESWIYNQEIRYGQVALTVTGKLCDGSPFQGTDTVFVNFAGDVNNDGKIDIVDAGFVSAHWSGPPVGPLGYDTNTDLNNDGLVNILDSGIVSSNWGQTVPQDPLPRR